MHLIALAQEWRNREGSRGRGAQAPLLDFGRSAKGGRLWPPYYCSPPQIFWSSAIFATAFSHAHRGCWSAINFSQKLFWGKNHQVTKLGAGPAEGLKNLGEGGREVIKGLLIEHVWLFIWPKSGWEVPPYPLAPRCRWPCSVVLFSLNETYQGSALSHIEGTLLCLPFTKIMAFCHKALFFQLP